VRVVPGDEDRENEAGHPRSNAEHEGAAEEEMATDPHGRTAGLD